MGPEGNIVTLHVHEGAVSYYISLSKEKRKDNSFVTELIANWLHWMNFIFLIIEKKILKIGLQMYVKIELRE